MAPIHEERKTVLTCARCGHVWQPEDATKLPKVCASCKSVRWNVVEVET